MSELRKTVETLKDDLKREERTYTTLQAESNKLKVDNNNLNAQIKELEG